MWDLMQIGCVGKPSSGKSTFFSAATLVDVEISMRPFTTIKANTGTAYVNTKCPHLDLGKQCNPINSKCVNGTRLIPIQLLDVAGLIEGSWQGKGMGNSFMSDLMQAQGLIHVLDIAGVTDSIGNPCQRGSHDPAQDIKFLEKEIAHWIKGILTKNWAKISKQASLDPKGPYEALAKNLTGLGITEEDVKGVIKKEDFNEKPDSWNEEALLEFSEKIREKSKPILIAANKIDVEGAQENFERLKKEFPEKKIVACSAESELALRKAAKADIIEYVPGEKEFKLLKQDIPEKQKHALEFIRTHILEKYGSTGVQEAVNETAFSLLDLIAVYPVQDQHKWTSGTGAVLPDSFLLRKGSNAIDLAGKIHTEFVERFVAAIDCRTGQKIGKEHSLKDGDVVKIMLR
ncbi:MAG: redox-regulated ATPase YchF [Candidatus Diapherotrites archaeon]